MTPLDRLVHRLWRGAFIVIGIVLAGALVDAVGLVP